MHPQRRDAFFGRRKGKPLRPGQQALVDRLLPRLRLDVTKPAPDNLASLFPHDPGCICLEIGFGAGEHLVEQALGAPDSGFIGAEPFVNAMAKALAAVDKHGLANIRLHDQDAVPLIAWLPRSSIDRIDLLYPDPWPKRRHWKRRIVNRSNLEQFARILRPGGRFRFASDWPGYVNWTLLHVTRQKEWSWTARTADDWRQPWPGWKRTRYEQKAVREGRCPAYLVFRRSDC